MVRWWLLTIVWSPDINIRIYFHVAVMDAIFVSWSTCFGLNIVTLLTCLESLCHQSITSNLKPGSALANYRYLRTYWQLENGFTHVDWGPDYPPAPPSGPRRYSNDDIIGSLHLIICTSNPSYNQLSNSTLSNKNKRNGLKILISKSVLIWIDNSNLSWQMLFKASHISFLEPSWDHDKVTKADKSRPRPRHSANNPPNNNYLKSQN